MSKEDRPWYEVLIVALLFIAMLVFLACGVLPIVFNGNEGPAKTEVSATVKYE